MMVGRVSAMGGIAVPSRHHGCLFRWWICDGKREQERERMWPRFNGPLCPFWSVSTDLQKLPQSWASLKRILHKIPQILPILVNISTKLTVLWGNSFKKVFMKFKGHTTTCNSKTKISDFCAKF
jgi:hypothetical protein